VPPQQNLQEDRLKSSASYLTRLPSSLYLIEGPILLPFVCALSIRTGQPSEYAILFADFSADPLELKHKDYEFVYLPPLEITIKTTSEP
jgi:hypothetical protein